MLIHGIMNWYLPGAMILLNINFLNIKYIIHCGCSSENNIARDIRL